MITVRASRVGSGIVVAHTPTARKARILAMLALTRAHDVARIQKMFDEY